MGKRTVRWWQLGIVPGRTCEICHGDGVTVVPPPDNPHAGSDQYIEVPCTCYKGQQLKKGKVRVQRF